MEGKKEKLFNLKPVRVRDFEKKENGRVVIIHPKFNSRPLTFLLKYMKKPNFRIELDEYGSFIWENCDGARTVEEIAELLREKFGENVEPVEERVTLFFIELYKSGFIKYRK